MKFVFELVPHRGCIYVGYELQDRIAGDGYKVHSEETNRHGFPAFEYFVDIPEADIPAFKQKYGV